MWTNSDNIPEKIQRHFSIWGVNIKSLILANLMDGDWKTMCLPNIGLLKFTRAQMRLLILLTGQPDYQVVEYEVT